MSSSKIYRPLVDEYALPISPAMVKAFGYSGAMFLSQVHSWLQTAERNGDSYKYEDGQWWTWNSYAEWQVQLYCMDVRTIKRTVARLELRGVLLSKKPDKHKGNHSKWYSIDYDKLNEVLTAVREEFSPEASEGGDKVSLEGGDTMPQASDTMTPVSSDTMPQGGDKVSLSYIEPNNSPNNGSNNPLEGECEGEGDQDQDGRKDRGGLSETPSEHQRLLNILIEKLSPPLAKEFHALLSKVASEVNPGGTLNATKRWQNFGSELMRLRGTYSDADLARGVSKALEHRDPGLRSKPKRLWGYVETIAMAKNEDDYPSPHPGRGAPQVRHSGMNSPEAAARRREDSEWFFDDNLTPKQKSDLALVEEMRAITDPEQIEEAIQAILSTKEV